MKVRRLFLQAGVLFAMAAGTVAVGAGIQGSQHDFSSMGWNASGEICLPCHTPHAADTSVPNSPLWNHQLSSASYTVYNSPTMDVTPEQPRGPTKLCLSCHDGTVALDSFGGNTGSTAMSGSAMVGPDLSDDHPVSVKWQHQTLDGFSRCGSCHNVHGGPSTFTSPLVWFDGYVECATCHDVHNASGNPSMLRMSNQASQLCLHCHEK